MDKQNTDPVKPERVTSVGKAATSTEQAAWRAARRRSRKRILVLVGFGALVCGALYSWWSWENKPDKAGWDAYKAEQYDQAIALFTRALRENPKNAGAYAGRGWSYYKKGDLGRTILDCNEAIRLAPELGDAYTAKAYALAAMEQAPKALETLNEGIRRDPKYAPAYYARADLARRHDLKGADPIADLQESIRLDPQSARAYALQGLLYSGREEYDKAIAACDKALEVEKALKLDDKEAQALAYLGRGLALCAKDQGRPGNEDIQKALRLDPRLQAVIDRMAKTVRGP